MSAWCPTLSFPPTVHVRWHCDDRNSFENFGLSKFTGTQLRHWNFIRPIRYTPLSYSQNMADSNAPTRCANLSRQLPVRVVILIIPSSVVGSSLSCNVEESNSLKPSRQCVMLKVERLIPISPSPLEVVFLLVKYHYSELTQYVINRVNQQYRNPIK